MIINDAYELNDEDDGGNWQARVNPLIPKEISAAKFTCLFLEGKIVDARAGGLVLAKISENDPARLIYKLGSSYVLDGTVSAGSFIMNRDASMRHRNRLKKMRAGLTLNEAPENSQGGVGQFVSCAAFPHNRLVFIDFNQEIIDPEPSEHHMSELNFLNMFPKEGIPTTPKRLSQSPQSGDQNRDLPCFDLLNHTRGKIGFFSQRFLSYALAARLQTPLYGVIIQMAIKESP